MTDVDPGLVSAADVFATVDGGAVESYGEFGGQGRFEWVSGFRDYATAVRCTVRRG